MVEDDLKKLAEWAKHHKVETNFDSKGSIALYADAGGMNVCIDGIKVKHITHAISALEAFREAGWKVN